MFSFKVIGEQVKKYSGECYAVANISYPATVEIMVNFFSKDGNGGEHKFIENSL